MLSAACAACSIVYDPAPPRQCQIDADCEGDAALSGRVCDTEYGVCVAPSSPAATGCQSTNICVQQNANRASLCRAPGQPCVVLETDECTSIVGDWRDPEAIILGSVGPHTQVTYGNRELTAVPYVPRLLDAINLGLEEWAVGVPPGLGTFGRPLALLHCDSAADAVRAKRVMDHLVQEVQTPLVMAVSDLDVAAIANLAVESNTALMCVACLGGPPEIELEHPLAWRIQPALEDQAPLAAWRVSDIERQLRAEGTLPAGSLLRVALMSQNYPGINEFVDQTRALLRFNAGQNVAQNAGSFFELQTGDARNEQVFQLDLAQAVADFAPHVIVVAIDSDFTTYYLRMLEDAWPVGVPRPHYVATSMNAEEGLLAPIVGANEDLRRRLSGTGLAADADVASNLDAFAARFRRRHLLEHDNTQYGYDAFYTAAYAVALADQEGGGGAAVVRALGALSRGPGINVGPDAIASALIYLLEQQSIDLVGASSRLDFDPLLGGAPSDVGLWCPTRTREGSLAVGANVGPRWSYTTGEIGGTYVCP